MEEIILDRDDIAAISSDVRVAILKALDARPMTVSELADRLGLAKSTVHQHLAVLAERDLVTHESIRKWRDYTLTKKAVRLLHPGRDHRIVIILGTSLIAVTAGVLCLVSYIRGYTILLEGSIYRDPLLLFAGEAFLGATIALWYLALRRWRRTRPGTEP